MSDNNVFVAIEGIDATGKTSVCTFLTEITNLQLIKTPSNDFNVASLYDKCKGALSKSHLYLAALHFSSELALQLTSTSHGVIADRYHLSVFTLLRLINSDINYVDIAIKLADKSIIKPSFIVYLYCDYNTCCNRILNRNKNIGFTDKYILDSYKFWEDADMFYRQFLHDSNIKNITIDTSEHTIAEICSIIKNELDGRTPTLST